MPSKCGTSKKTDLGTAVGGLIWGLSRDVDTLFPVAHSQKGPRGVLAEPDTFIEQTSFCSCHAHV
jgi:hypothetical protein